MKVLGLSVVALLTAALVATGVFLSGVVQASHNFSDVPTTAFYHNAVEWIFNRGITAGCAAGLYCPDAAVTRGTMAVFLRALGTALTPTFLNETGGVPPIDPDANPIICQTADYTPPFPQLARVDSWVSFEAGGFMDVNVNNQVSTNAGAAWSSLDLTASFAGGAASNEAAQANQHSIVNLNPGTSYRFAVGVSRRSGTADTLSTRCEVMVTIFNRNPATPPLRP